MAERAEPKAEGRLGDVAKCDGKIAHIRNVKARMFRAKAGAA